MTIEHEPDEPIDGPSLWQRFNNWQLRSLASAEVHVDERHERRMLLRTRRLEWVLMAWFAAAWFLALLLPDAANVLQKSLVALAIALPLLTLGYTRWRVWQGLDEWMRRKEQASLIAAGTMAIALLGLREIFEVLNLPWPLHPLHELMLVALTWGFTHCFARRRGQ